MKLTALALIFLAACASVDAPPAAPQTQPGSEEFDIKATVLATYNVISGPAGRRDWNRFKDLFAPGARLIHKDKVMTPEEFSTESQKYFAEHGFFERPVSTRIDRYHDVAQVWSAYESRNNSNDDKPFARGVNSFQLVRAGGQWKVLTILWQEE